MAEKIKDAAKPFDPETLRSDISLVNDMKARAAEENGRAAKATAEACDRSGYDKTAFTFVAKLARKEPAQALQTIAAAVVYAEAEGLFRQMDMFNDAVSAMQAVIDRAQAGGAAPAGAANVAKLAAGAGAH